MIDCAGLMLYKKELLIVLGLDPELASQYADNAPSFGISKIKALSVLASWVALLQGENRIAVILSSDCCPYCVAMRIESKSVECDTCPYGSMHKMCNRKTSTWWAVCMLAYPMMNIQNKEQIKMILKEARDYIEGMQ